MTYTFIIESTNDYTQQKIYVVTVPAFGSEFQFKHHELEPLLEKMKEEVFEIIKKTNPSDLPNEAPEDVLDIEQYRLEPDSDLRRYEVEFDTIENKDEINIKDNEDISEFLELSEKETLESLSDFSNDDIETSDLESLEELEKQIASQMADLESEFPDLIGSNQGMDLNQEDIILNTGSIEKELNDLSSVNLLISKNDDKNLESDSLVSKETLNVETVSMDELENLLSEEQSAIDLKKEVENSDVSNITKDVDNLINSLKISEDIHKPKKLDVETNYANSTKTKIPQETHSDLNAQSITTSKDEHGDSNKQDEKKTLNKILPQISLKPELKPLLPDVNSSLKSKEKEEMQRNINKSVNADTVPSWHRKSIYQISAKDETKKEEKVYEYPKNKHILPKAQPKSLQENEHEQITEEKDFFSEPNSIPTIQELESSINKSNIEPILEEKTENTNSIKNGEKEIYISVSNEGENDKDIEISLEEETPDAGVMPQEFSEVTLVKDIGENDIVEVETSEPEKNQEIPLNKGQFETSDFEKEDPVTKPFIAEHKLNKPIYQESEIAKKRSQLISSAMSSRNNKSSDKLDKVKILNGRKWRRNITIPIFIDKYLRDNPKFNFSRWIATRFLDEFFED